MAVSNVRSLASHVQAAASDAADLTLGSSGESVSALQEKLNAAGAALTVDGKFGAATQRAVKKFQTQAGLTSDGVAGPKTLAALAAPSTPPATNTTRDQVVQGPLGTGARSAPTHEQLREPASGVRAASLANVHSKGSKLNVGPKANPTTQGLGYEPSINNLFARFPDPKAAASAIAARHPNQTQIALNEISTTKKGGLATLPGKRGDAYRSWLTNVAKDLVHDGKKPIICSPVSGDANVGKLYQSLAKVNGVKLGMETQITGNDNTKAHPGSVEWKLNHTLNLMQGLGIAPSKLVHVVNLANTGRGANFGKDGGSQAQFDANIQAETREAKRLGFAGVLGYGFNETGASIEAWNKA